MLLPLRGIRRAVFAPSRLASAAVDAVSVPPVSAVSRNAESFEPFMHCVHASKYGVDSAHFTGFAPASASLKGLFWMQRTAVLRLITSPNVEYLPGVFTMCKNNPTRLANWDGQGTFYKVGDVTSGEPDA